MSNNTKVYSIEILRLAFVLILCLWHFYPARPPYLYHGYLVVDFFFILSGFLLYRSYCYHSNRSPLDYVISRFIKFGPDYLVALLICIMIHIVHDFHFDFHLYDILKNVMGTVCDALMLQSIGVFNHVAGWHNNPMWFMSVLLFGGGIVYGLLYYNRNLALCILMPIGCIWIYSYLLNSYGQLEVWTVNHFGLYLAFLRGVADLSLGVLSAAAFESKSLLPFKKVLRSPLITGILLVISMLLLFVWHSLDAYVLILYPIIIISLFDQEHLYNRVSSKYLLFSTFGELAWCMFVFHYIIVECFDFFIPSINFPYFDLLLYVMLVLGVSWGWIKIKRSFGKFQEVKK